MSLRGWIAVTLISGALAMGCEKAPEPPKIDTKPSPQAAAPSTQQLLSGPSKKVWLTPLSLTARVPESWDLKTPEGTTLHLLQGPGLDGQSIQLSLEIGTAVTGEQLKNILQGAQ